jgi:photosystem II stability/assembly factor-like uncharacterized protein
MLDSQSGWAIAQTKGGSLSRLFFTSDGGWNWQDRTPPTRPPAEGENTAQPVFFASGRDAWISYANPLGHNEFPLLVWHTTDKGLTWQASQPLDFGSIVQEFRVPSDLAFLDNLHGHILVHLGVGMSHDYVAVFTTADAGQTWQRFLDPDTQPTLMGCAKSGLAFTSPEIAWLAGDCPGLMKNLTLYRTLDAGATWSDVSLPVPSGKPENYFALDNIGCGIAGFHYTGKDTLYLSLRCTNFDNSTNMTWLYATSDNGKTWQQSPLPLPYVHLAVLDPNKAILIGSTTQENEANGAVFSTSDAGRNWNQAASTSWTGVPDFIDTQNGWVVAVRGSVSAFVHTSDGGRSWEEIKPVVGP